MLPVYGAISLILWTGFGFLRIWFGEMRRRCVNTFCSFAGKAVVHRRPAFEAKPEFQHPDSSFLSKRTCKLTNSRTRSTSRLCKYGKGITCSVGLLFVVCLFECSLFFCLFRRQAVFTARETYVIFFPLRLGIFSQFERNRVNCSWNYRRHVRTSEAKMEKGTLSKNYNKMLINVRNRKARRRKKQQ